MIQTDKYVDKAFDRGSSEGLGKVRLDEDRLAISLLGHMPKLVRLVVICAWPTHLPSSNQLCILCVTYRFAEC
jgi:hypothetical protein